MSRIVQSFPFPRARRRGTSVAAKIVDVREPTPNLDYATAARSVPRPGVEIWVAAAIVWASAAQGVAAAATRLLDAPSDRGFVVAWVFVGGLSMGVAIVEWIAVRRANAPVASGVCVAAFAVAAVLFAPALVAWAMLPAIILNLGGVEASLAGFAVALASPAAAFVGFAHRQWAETIRRGRHRRAIDPPSYRGAI